MLLVMRVLLPNIRYSFHPVSHDERRSLNDSDSEIGQVVTNLSQLTVPYLSLSRDRTHDLGFVGPFELFTPVLAFRDSLFHGRLNLDLGQLYSPLLIPLIFVLLCHRVKAKMARRHQRRPGCATDLDITIWAFLGLVHVILRFATTPDFSHAKLYI